MDQRSQLETQLRSWTDAGLIDASTASRILAFESAHERRATLRWPIFLAMVFGGILVAAGATLFVAAHWSELSPAIRFSLVLSMVAVFHIGGALLAEHFPPLSTTSHALGTATLGAAIFLTAQIFNLHEDWATGVLIWAIGAAVAYLLLREWVQAALLALLVPAWLISQWSISTEWHTGGDRVLAVGLILVALCYMSARIGDESDPVRKTLVWIGSIALLPSICAALVFALGDHYRVSYLSPPSSSTLLVGWIIALIGPLLLAWFLRGRAVWINFLWAAWAYALVLSATYSNPFESNRSGRDLFSTLALYSLCALGSIGLVAWGLREKRKERLNLGIAAFAISVLFFYFDSFMGKLGRSASLLVLGAICLAGGYVLEVARRKLISRMEAHQ